MFEMPKPGYKSVSVPEEMIAHIEKIIKEHNTLYRTVADFVKDSIRRRIEYLSSLEEWGVEELEREVLRRQQQSE